ncbi:geranylgeranyl transferase type II beta subunit, putative [Eimeria brunetti]|uniref:Geranylgeranyl transferase type II subunit beta n=1 Tax=Eimeria brunetti TaxID=51314 RepID=U6L9E8_9EIME|nr:geranylgeranyl transferase type II beta subunit, putative [Eimeria brunetti]
MEGEGGGEEGTTAADAPALWCLNITAHRQYILLQLQRGLRIFSSTAFAEMSSASSIVAPSDAAHVPFMELQQQQHSLLSGVYWTLCCLSLLKPQAAVSPSSKEEPQPPTTPLPLPQKVKDDLIYKVILRCLRRRQCSGWVSAAEGVESREMPAEGETRRRRNSTMGSSSRQPVLPSRTTTEGVATASRAHCERLALGFSSNLAEDATPTALSTCSGLQALTLLEALPVLSEDDLQQLRRFVLSLQREEDGAFANTFHPSCWNNSCGSCSPAMAGQAVLTAPAAAAKEDGKLDNEGDVRCTFCCLLSLKLIHAAAKAQRKRMAVPSQTPAAAAAACAVVCAAEKASAGMTPAQPTAGEPASCGKGPAEFGPLTVQGPEKPLHAAHWEAFLRDPLAGVRVDAAFSWLLSLLSSDGGVGVSPGAEPHAGAAFCFAGCLSILGKRDSLGSQEARKLERQVQVSCTLLLGAALQRLKVTLICVKGRPGKKGDTCYTFWVTAALLLLGSDPLKVLEPTALAAAVASAQHPSGGLSRAPTRFPSVAQDRCATTAANWGHAAPLDATKGINNDNSSSACNSLRLLSMGPLDSSEEQLRCPDPYHTFFALAGLALLAHCGDEGAMQPEQQPQQPHQDGQELQMQQFLRWQATCKQLLQPLDPETALPLKLAKSL